MAVRAAVSVAVPLLLLVSLDRAHWVPYAAFGAFTSLYGRASDRADRAGMQAMAGASLVLSVVLGVLVSQLPHHAWWVVGCGALVAAGGSLLAHAGAIGQLIGGTRPYWAMVAVAASRCSPSPRWHSSWARSAPGHRSARC